MLLKDGTLVDEDLLQAIQRVVVSQEFLVLRARFNVETVLALVDFVHRA